MIIKPFEHFIYDRRTYNPPPKILKMGRGSDFEAFEESPQQQNLFFVLTPDEVFYEIPQWVFLLLYEAQCSKSYV